MTNNHTPIARIDDLIATLTTLKQYALEVEGDLRLDNPLADANDAMIDAFDILADDVVEGIALISRDDFTKIKSLITNP